MKQCDRVSESYDVFVSYSHKDQAIANKIVTELERLGIRCWYAPRDIWFGEEWESAVTSAIRGTKVFVLVYTGESNMSAEVIKEVDLAAREHKEIVSFALTREKMQDSLVYRLTYVHWLMAANKPLKKRVRELRNVLATILRELDGNLSDDYTEPESQSDDVAFAPRDSPSSVSIPERASHQPQATSRRRAGLFGGIRGLVSDAFDRLGERSQPGDTDPAPIGEKSSAAAAPPISSVQFAAISPRTAPRSSYSTVDIIMYEDGWEDAVANVAKEHDEATRTTASGWVGAREGTTVVVRLSSPELGNIGERAGTWHGRFLRFGFFFKIPGGFCESEALLDAEVLFDGVPATRLSFVVEVGRSGEETPTVERRDITSAFMSYSSKDRGRVAVLMQGIETVRPDLDVFLDVEKLRCGDEWERILSDEIKKRDVLFLCWSRAASESRWVDYEWRCAYESKGLKGIEPVAIEPPDRCPPPKELESMHFNSRLLYIANSMSDRE